MWYTVLVKFHVTQEAAKMQVHVYETAAQVGQAAATLFAAQIIQKPDSVFGLATGSSPVGCYRQLIAWHQAGVLDFSKCVSYNLDEYCGLPEEHPCSYHAFMNENLFQHISMKAHYVPDGNAADPEAECRRYAALLQAHPCDIVCMGIGENGHIAFNDPHVADFGDKAAVKVVALDETCRQQQVNDGCFARLDDVPTHALTLTIPTLTAPEAVFCIVPAKTKANAVYAALRGGITEACPASILRRHANATLYCDADSAARVL